MAKDDACRRLSRAMVRLLRHDARRMGVPIDSGGFVKLDIALQACDNDISLPDLYQRWHEIVAKQEGSNCKQRFEQVGRVGITYVRALQGHTDRSMDPAIMYADRELDDKVEVGYHGTAWQNVEKIRREGLKAKRRVGVHFYRDRAVLVQKNPPEKREVVVVVNVRRAADAGLRFWDTTGVSFLGPRNVPACFIDQIVSADGTDVDVIVKGKGDGSARDKGWRSVPRGGGRDGADCAPHAGGGQKGMGYGSSHDKGGRFDTTVWKGVGKGIGDWKGAGSRQKGKGDGSARDKGGRSVPRGGGRDGADCAPHGGGYSTGGRGEAAREKDGEPGSGWECVVADFVWTRPCHDKRTLKDVQYEIRCALRIIRIAYGGEEQQYEISAGLRGNLYSICGSQMYFRYYQCIDGQWVEGRLSINRFLDGRKFEDLIATVDQADVYPLAVYQC